MVILSGGPGFDYDYILPVATEISKTNWAIPIELRGTGRSLPKTINPETINPKAYLSDLQALRTHLQLDRWTLLGHSEVLGGHPANAQFSPMTGGRQNTDQQIR